MKTIGPLAPILLLLVGQAFSWEEVQYDFRGNDVHSERIQVVGDQQYIRQQDEGLTVVIPAATAQDNVGLTVNHTLVGDFEISASFELLDLPRPTGGYGTGAALLIEDGIRYGASLQRIRTAADEQVFFAHHYEINSSGEYEHHAVPFPATSDSGVLRIVREGPWIKYLVAEADSDEFRELHSVRLTNQPIPFLQIYAQPGGARNAVSVRLKELKIRAEQLPQPERVFTTASNSFLKWGVLSLLLSTIVGGVWWWNNSALAN